MLFTAAIPASLFAANNTKTNCIMRRAVHWKQEEKHPAPEVFCRNGIPGKMTGIRSQSENHCPL
jgi:hypothetical protein